MVKPMKLTLSWVQSSLALLLLGVSASAQTPFLFRMTLRGTCYQANPSGDIVSTPITEITLLQDAAQAGGVDPKNLALVYHVQGSSFGDTIDIVVSLGMAGGHSATIWGCDLSAEYVKINGEYRT